MRFSVDRSVFDHQLLAWSIRGALSALPSLLWALTTGFDAAAEIAAMLSGVAMYIVAFAWLTALPAYRERVEPTRIGWSLRWAANSRAALAPVMFFASDLMLGAIAVGIVHEIAASAGVLPALASADFTATDLAMSRLDSFSWTLLMTLVQGLLVTVTMLLFVPVLALARSIFERLRR